MIVAVDVYYTDEAAAAACVTFQDWTDPSPVSEHIARIDQVAPYEPGQFFRRELPCILRVLEASQLRPDIILVDGYVWLGPEGLPGLGAHLYEALEETVAVIGVAKTRFRDTPSAVAVYRGSSRAPLYVTAAGMDVEDAAGHIREMNGPYRVPTLIRRADMLSRSGALELNQMPCCEIARASRSRQR